MEENFRAKKSVQELWRNRNFKRIRLYVQKRERIGIIGDNGVGKSTFLNIITQNEPADSGKINSGDTIVYGYFTQKGITIDSKEGD